MRGRWICLIFIIVLCAVADSVPNAQATRLSEYRVKAAFVYNFAKFIDWPAKAFPDGRAPLTLCILGKDPFGVALETIKGKTVKGRKLVIQHVARIEDLDQCHILFISASEEKHVEKILETLKDSSVLTIGEMKMFAQRGGIIHLTVKESKVRFGINVDAAKRAGLKISSKLLKLSRVVTDKREE